MLLPELAEKIVKEVQKLIGEDIIVVNTEGHIIASTDPVRVGTFHEGALLASQKKRKRIITEEDQLKLEGVKAGINFPIFFQNDVIGVIGITGEPKKVTPFGEIIRKMTELLISENYYAEQFDWHTRAVESFVMDWVQAKEWDETFQNRAKLLSIDIEVKRAVVIIEFLGLNSPLSRDNWSSIFNRFKQNTKEVVARSGNERMVLLINCSNGPSRASIEKWLMQFLNFLTNTFGIHATAGVGQAAEPHDIRISYRQAERSLKIKKATGNITFDEDLTLEMIFEEISSKTKSDFISRTIGPLLKEVDLLETLNELFKQNHSLKNTSNKLHIHINTLHYRLKKAEELTQLSPNNIHDLLTMYLALLFLDEQTKIKK
ncbi:helix-turn-helix domain-containing protein [Bacillus sp. sid0103]|uniref:CdaR family transcriptional regulator n=1 Tax=Bacillus sp. sid0103 TaxID=2856337 RepID=UPI001C4483D6|nr:sugar diacid recognition domain-containing protein [Bacillus sp. sid0103]MBV7503966.1 helix-turn-helix domain-containing protein [Bacillus sp. sid0103]